jgi:hypothetical protein
MGRFLAGVVSALLLVGAGIFIWKSIAQADDPIPPPTRPSLLAAPTPLGDPPSADRSREEKRFDRYDKDRDDIITRPEYLATRQKAFARLDLNNDGKLDFEEWAARTTAKFAKADADKSATLNRVEFTTTRVIRTPTTRCSCPQDSNSAE